MSEKNINQIIAREANEEDVKVIRNIFHENYSDDYPLYWLHG